MRKTLTAIVIVLAASSLAACKMFWEKDAPPAPVATSAETTPTEPMATAETPKPVEQAATDAAKPAPTPETTTPSTPATK